MVEFNQIKASIQTNTVYVCSCCGKRQVGDTVSLTYRGQGPSDLQAFLRNFQQKSRDMPVGWSFDGQFKCAKCKGN